MATEVVQQMNVLREAQQIVGGDRMHHYGEPATNHRRTSRFFHAYFASITEGMTAEQAQDRLMNLDPEDVCWLNALQKIARNAEVRKRDNLVDVAGYVLNIELIRDDLDAQQPKPLLYESADEL